MYTLNCKGRLLTIDKPIVMGILNLTPDSFYKESRALDHDNMISRAGQLLKDGAAILDIGGQSTRPGSERVSAAEEMERIVEPIASIIKEFPQAIISVDTFYAEVARAAVDAGASIVNDISGGWLDENMIEVVAELGVPFVCMHMKGTPQIMASLNQYTDMVQELMDYFIERIETCKSAGINDVILDPGFGFAKNAEQNFLLLRESSFMNALGRPWLAGISRKGMIHRTLGISVENSLNGTTVLNTVALLKGASILRVHDAREAKEAIELVEALNKKEESL